MAYSILSCIQTESKCNVFMITLTITVKTNDLIDFTSINCLYSWLHVTMFFQQIESKCNTV